MLLGDPHWSSDTPEETAACEGPRLEQEKGKKEGAGENKGRKSGAATRNLHIPTQHPALGVVSPKGLAGTECNVVKEGESGLKVEGEVLV